MPTPRSDTTREPPSTTRLSTAACPSLMPQLFFTLERSRTWPRSDSTLSHWGSCGVRLWQVAIPAGLLKEKGNDLEIEVVNLWPNRMIGDEQLPDDCEFSGGVWNLLKSYPDWFRNRQPRCSGRVSFANMRCWEKDSPLLASGLLGPVMLRTARGEAVRHQ